MLTIKKLIKQNKYIPKFCSNIDRWVKNSELIFKKIKKPLEIIPDTTLLCKIEYFFRKLGGCASLANRKDVKKPAINNGTIRLIKKSWKDISEIIQADKIPHITDVVNPNIFKIKAPNFSISFKSNKYLLR
jgi:hypothetical protein